MYEPSNFHSAAFSFPDSADVRCDFPFIFSLSSCVISPFLNKYSLKKDNHISFDICILSFAKPLLTFSSLPEGQLHFQSTLSSLQIKKIPC